MASKADKQYIFEQMPIPQAVIQLSIPIIISSLVTIIYNLADTFFVGMLNNPIIHTISIVFPIMLCLTAVYWIFSRQLILTFIQEPDIVEYGTVFLRRMCIGICFHFCDFLVVNIYQALGMGKRALTCAIIRKVVLEIPLLFVLNYLNPLYGLASAQCITETVMSVIAITTLLRIFKEEKCVPEDRPLGVISKANILPVPTS